MSNIKLFARCVNSQFSDDLLKGFRRRMGHLFSKQKKGAKIEKRKPRSSTGLEQQASVNVGRPVPAVPSPRPFTSPQPCTYGLTL